MVEKNSKSNVSKLDLIGSIKKKLLKQKDVLANFSNVADKSFDEKFRSAILGFAVGDALGVPVEFLSRNRLQKNPVEEMLGFGSHHVPEGTWSDDTSLTIAAMDSIVETKKIDFDDIMGKFVQWVDDAKYTATDELFDIGISTRKSILNFQRGVEATKCGSKSFNENGNGSLMRILPFSFYLKANNFDQDERVKLINLASSLTHAHEISCLGCMIYTDYVGMLMDGIDKKEAYVQLKNIDYGKYYSKDSIKVYDRILKDNLDSFDIDDIQSTGYVVSSLEASLWCTLNSESYEEAVVKAVNLGDDTDTIGAITGSLNGIIYGKKQIPEKWLNKLRKKEYLEELSDDFINVIRYEMGKNKLK